MKKILLRFCLGACLLSAVSAFAVGCGEAENGWVDVTPNGSRPSIEMIDYKVDPIIALDFGGYSAEELPNAVKGKSYQIFPATAKDIYENALAVTVRVYMNYYTSFKAEVSVLNGGFVPEFYGVYTVEYTATDVFGNQSTKSYDVLCLEKDALDVSFSLYEQEGMVGHAINVATPVYTNVSGNVSTEIRAVLKEGNVEYIIGDNMAFKPKYAGTYEIVYDFADYNETGSKSYEVTVADNPNPVFDEAFSLNDYYIMDCTYELPIPDCFYSTAGRLYNLTPSVSVEYADGKTEKLDGYTFEPKKAGEVEIVYRAQFGDKEEIIRQKAVVVDVGYSGVMDMSKYFYGENVKFETLDYGISVRTATNTAFDFINAISSREVSLSFAINSNENNFNAFAIYLTDSEDRNATVKFSFVRNGNKGLLYVNDGDFASVSQGFNATQTAAFVYDNATQTATLGESIALEVKKTLSGEVFKGFSDKVLVSFAFEEVSGYAGVYLYQISNQVLSNEEGDGFRPFISFSLYAHGEHYLGDVVQLDRIWVCDVLDPNYWVTFYVKKPSGEYVTSVDGSLLNNADYTVANRFVVDELGLYIIGIIIGDSFGNQLPYSYSVTVTDNVAPTLTFGKGTTECKFGDTITLRKATASDNLTKNMTINSYVYLPDMTMVTVDNGGKYKPTQRGEHTVFYHVQDEHANVTIVKYTFVVK